MAVTVTSADVRSCSTCGHEKDAGDFYLSNRWQCKECLKEKSQAWAESNREKRRKIGREYAQRNPHKSRERRLRSEFNMSPEQYDNMLEQQAGVCAICRQPERVRHQSGTMKNLAVDHCHETGQVRGLLCDHCNRGIGMLMHDKGILLQAVQYLGDH